MRQDSCLFITCCVQTLLLVCLLDKIMPVHMSLASSNNNYNYCCSRIEEFKFGTFLYMLCYGRGFSNRKI